MCVQIDRLQPKKLNETVWSKTQVGTDKQVLSTHFLTFITPLVVMLSCRQLSCSKISCKNKGRCAILLQDSKACKAKSKIQCRGIYKQEMGRQRKVKGRLPSDNPAAALPGFVE
jgi:hypothetical protein